MTLVRELELPEGWAQPRLARVFDVFDAAVAALPVGLIAIGLRNVGLGDRPLFAIAVMLCGIGCGGLSIMIIRNRLRLRQTAIRGVGLAEDDDGAPVLRIRQPRALQMATCAWLLSAGGGVLLFGASLLAGGAMTGILYLLCGAFVALPLAQLLRGAPLSEVRLGPETVRHSRGGRSLAAAWDDVEFVVATKTRYRRQIFLRAREVQGWSERPAWSRRRDKVVGIEIHTDHFEVSPVLLFHVLRFYHAHPAARAELGTAASLQRLRDGRLVAP